MIREFHLADFFTLANARVRHRRRVLRDASSSRRQSLRYFLVAAALAPAAFVFDVLDGRIARWRQTHSALGRELDSLADVISFGVAPAALGFAAGLHGGWDWVALIYFVCCGVGRLARFNVTAEKLSEGAARSSTSKARRFPRAWCSPACWRSPRGRGGSGDNLYGGAWRSGLGNCIRSCCCSSCPAR